MPNPPANSKKPRMPLSKKSSKLILVTVSVAISVRWNQLFWPAIKIRRCTDGWLKTKTRTVVATDDGHQIMALCRQFLSQYWQGQGIHQVQVTALDPRPAHGQLDMFSQGDEMKQVNGVMDSINERYGEFTLAPARLLNRSRMPNVIAPAWKPYGHRQTV